VPATLAQTTSVERLARFYYGASRGRDSTRLIYPAAYFEWVERLPGANRYLDAVLIDSEHRVAGLAFARPLTLGMWANMKLRSAIQEASAIAPYDRSAKGWVRYLTRLRDRDLAIALQTVLPEEFYALRTAVVEFLEVAPELAESDEGARERESVLLDVLLGEARASGYDYVLVWSEAGRPVRQLSRAAGSTALYEEIPAAERGVLGVVNFWRRLYRSIVGWVGAKRASLARIPGRLRRRLAEARAGHWRKALFLQADERGEVDWDAIVREQRERLAADPVTLDGIRIRRIGSAATPLDAVLVGRLRDLIANASERFALFPTYSPEQVLAALTPTHAETRFINRYAAIHEAAADFSRTDLDHDTLAFAAERDGRILALIFGHRLPRLDGDGIPYETFAIRAAYFAPDLGAITRADLLQHAAEGARRALGIGTAIYLRPAGLRHFAFSRYVLGARRASAPLHLRYLPLSERARAEEGILRRTLPIGYL
jgi:hypothetical protein